MLLQLKLKFEQKYYLAIITVFLAEVLASNNCALFLLSLILFILLLSIIESKLAIKYIILFILSSLYTINYLPSLSEAYKIKKAIEDSSKTTFIINGIIDEDIKRIGLNQIRISCVSNFLGLKNAKLHLESSALPWEKLYRLGKGDKINVLASIKSIVEQKNIYPNPFSYEAFLFRRGIVASGKVLEVNWIKTNPNAKNRKEVFLKEILNKFPANEELSLIFAATLGYNYLLDSYTKDLFKQTGLMHLVVVSGYHVAVIFSVIYFLIRKTLLQSKTIINIYPISKIVPICSLCIVYQYCNIVGDDLTVIRALLAIIIISYGKFIAKKADSINSLAFVFLLVLIFYPTSFYEAGCQLTFLALLGLNIAANIQNRYFSSLSGIRKFMVSRILFTGFPTVFTTPIIYFWFNFFSPFTLIYNLFFSEVFCLIFILLPAICFIAFYFDINFINTLFSFNIFIANKYLWLLEQSS